jgi:glucose/arabinose dehydrogenase/cytochrome c553
MNTYKPSVLVFPILIFLTGFISSIGSQKIIPIEPKLEDLDFPEPYRLEVVAENLRAPWSIEFLADGRILFTEKTGRVRIIENDSLLKEPALILPVTLNGTSGMFSIVAHPDFEENGWVYISSSYDTGEDLWLEVNRFTMEGNKLTSPTRIIAEIPCNVNHSGGRLRFGPDGKLYLTTSDRNKPPLAQKLDNLIGKILRFNPDGSIPEDNPFVETEGARPEIYTYGHRNPQGLSFHPEDGSLWEAEHGNGFWDEFNQLFPKHNYGWPVIEGMQVQGGMEPPALSLVDEPALAVSGCLIYSGKAFPSLKHHGLLATLQGASLIRAHIENGQVVKADRYFHMAFGRLREVAESPEGYIYFSTSFYDARGQRKWKPLHDSDRILRIVPANAPRSRFQVVQADHERERTLPNKFASDLTFETPVDQSIHKNCAACHGPNLKGGIQSSLVDGIWALGAAGTDDELFDIIFSGRPMAGMMGFRNTLKRDEIREIVTYIRSQELKK